MPLAQLADPWRKMAIGIENRYSSLPEIVTSSDLHRDSPSVLDLDTQQVLEDSLGDEDNLPCQRAAISSGSSDQRREQRSARVVAISAESSDQLGE
ncbi:hypothetical protein C0J50_22718 [Silurus asotus]|uniref:Uncharacterized protein n=1 Tax=Silurus asotus TaxID=30991 RepID=A0AAD5FJA8_SILAS|nr:hypothetical protein C0J50_22718 [Silurus asotus]